VEKNRKNKMKTRTSLLDCVESKVIWDYRNKCEFTFGFDKNEERSVGFRIGRYKDKTIQVFFGFIFCQEICIFFIGRVSREGAPVNARHTISFTGNCRFYQKFEICTI